jgi:hypothetical protein
VAHAINLLIHLACIAALFFALSQLLKLYRESPAPPAGEAAFAPSAVWGLLPGVASLLFAVSPWAAEPVCYVSARNASLGTLFVLLGLGAWAAMLHGGRRRWVRVVLGACACLCALAAFGCKENLITWPVLWQRASRLQTAKTAALVAGAAVLMCGVALFGLRASDRAAGLWNQVFLRGWDYFFSIQNPLVLMTLGDQVPACRLSLEFNHPQWPVWACGVALAANAALVLLGVLGGKRWPALLGLTWFYLHLAPTNSFLPRPDFLAARNVYLPAAGIAVLLAGALLYAAARAFSGQSSGDAGRRRAAAVLARSAQVAVGLLVALVLYWAIRTYGWAGCYAEPERVWARSAAVAPDHAAVRLNLAGAILSRHAPAPATKADWSDALREVDAALAADNSPTMMYHSERPKAVRRALSFRLLGLNDHQNGNMVGAEQYFRQSWSYLPCAATWVGWGGACLDGKLWPQLQDVIAAGLAQWPGQWWPQAMRGLMLASQGAGGQRAADARRDLAAAAAVPDEPIPELRALQMLSLHYLAQGEMNMARREALLRRVQKLGSARGQ